MWEWEAGGKLSCLAPYADPFGQLVLKHSGSDGCSLGHSSLCSLGQLLL